jgi:DNA-binding GntR family transcriptional regulator
MPRKTSYFEREAVQVGRYAKSLPEQVMELLLAAIHEGAIEPGERMLEEVYAERFAVSRSTIREAMALLERRGVVERVPRYGVRVTAFDPAEIEEIFNIRAQLLGLAARLAAEQQPEELIEELQAGLAKIRALAGKPRTTPIAYMEMSVHMQRMLVGASSGKRLRRIYEDLSDQALWRYAIREKAISFRTPQRRKESAADWERVVAAIVSGDGEAAERMAKALLHASYRAVKDLLPGREPG